MLKFRLIMLTVIVFYFVQSQVTPYFHFHHHDHESHDKLTLSAETSNDECTHSLSCKIHMHDHEMLKADWNVVNQNQNIQLETAFDPLEILPDILVDVSSNRQIFILQENFYKLEFILSNYSNKAPPLFV